MSGGAETIQAPITAPGQAAVAVLRLSGPDCRDALAKMTPDSERVLETPRRAVYCTLDDITQPLPYPLLDRAVATFFQAPNSYTGEDVVEIAVHGSTFIMRRIIECFESLGLRLARPGEFTERAFLNGKIDLSQSEAVLDVIHAETELQSRLAHEQLEGRLSDAVSRLGEPLRDALAEIEAFIDFPDEDIDPLTAAAWKASAERAVVEIDAYLATYRSGRLCRDGAKVVLVGVPNAGKSSLMNVLSGESRVIVTPIPGTTRDSIEEVISLDGLKVNLWDTAGLVDEETSERALDEVERLGIQRSWAKAKQADLLVFVFDGTQDADPQQALLTHAASFGRPILLLFNKADLVSQEALEAFRLELADDSESLAFSALEGTSADLETLRALIRSSLLGELPKASLIITHERHAAALRSAKEALLRSVSAINGGLPPELVAADVREALGQLSDIIGVTHTEDILGRIFSKFCIGK